MNVPIGDTYYFKFTTRQFSTGAPFALASGVISVYEENNLTQITAGITLTASYDSVTGLNDVAIVATSGNGYEVGKYYNAVITTGTVDSVSVVGEVVGHFRVMPAEDAGAGIPDVNATHLGDTAQTGRDIGASVLLSSGTGTGQVSLSSGLVTLAGVTHTGAVIPTVSTLTGHTAQTGDSFARLGAPAGASLSADVADVESRIPAALSGGRMASDVEAISGSTAAADNLEASALGIISGVAQTGTLNTTTMTTDLTGYANDELINRVVVWTSGTAQGQAATITDYANTNGTVSFAAITTAPANNDAFVIV